MMMIQMMKWNNYFVCDYLRREREAKKGFSVWNQRELSLFLPSE
jgi:hypothetical protein